MLIPQALGEKAPGVQTSEEGVLPGWRGHI